MTVYRRTVSNGPSIKNFLTVYNPFTVLTCENEPSSKLTCTLVSES